MTAPSDTATARFLAMPEHVRDEYEKLVDAMRRFITGPETTESFDTMVNARLLVPHGLVCRTTWDAATRTISQEITTTEAYENVPS